MAILTATFKYDDNGKVSRLDVTGDGPGCTCFAKDFRSLGDMVSHASRMTGVPIETIREALAIQEAAVGAAPPTETSVEPAVAEKPKRKAKKKV